LKSGPQAAKMAEALARAFTPPEPIKQSHRKIMNKMG
jgi:hypothetical protein